MNVRLWIKIIGISTIVLASLTLLTDFIFIGVQTFFGKMHEKDLGEFPRLLMWKSYLGIPVHLFLLGAGILFLKRHAYGLNLLIAAILISTIGELIPLNPFGPIYIYIALLIGAYELKQFYYLSPEDIARMQGGTSEDVQLPERNVRSMVIIAYAFLFIPLLLIVLWFYASAQGADFETTKRIYLSFLPEILHAYGRASMVSVVMCLASLFFGIRSLITNKVRYRIFSIAAVAIAALLMLMNVWSLM